MRYTNLTVLLILLCAGAVAKETWQLKDGEKWESIATDPQRQYALKVAELKDLVRTGKSEAVEDILAELKGSFPSTSVRISTCSSRVKSNSGKIATPKP
jgi:hypothetical protein